MDCFGEFHLGHAFCSHCAVVRSCKRESLSMVRSSRERDRIRRLKVNTLEAFHPEQVVAMLASFVERYEVPVSTYRLTRDFRRYLNVNVSDSRVLDLCLELLRMGRIRVIVRGNARYWARVV